VRQTPFSRTSPIYRYGSGVPRINTGSGRLHVELEYEYGDRVEWAFDASPQAGAVQPTMTARCETHIALLPHRQLYYETHIALLPHRQLYYGSHIALLTHRQLYYVIPTLTGIPVLQTRAPSFLRSRSLSSLFADCSLILEYLTLLNC
jgi:hypothetical protein